MKYHVRFSNRVFVVDVEGTRVTVDGEALEAHFARIPGTPLRHLLLGPDGSSWTVAAQRLEGPGRWALGLAGERLEVEVVDDRTRQIQELTGRSKPTGRGGTVVAPMPGLVVRIEVTEGQEIGEHTSELQSPVHLVCRLLLEKKKNKKQ